MNVRPLIRDARAEFTDQPWSLAELAEVELRLSEPLRVALVGKLKSGKSTLLNALVGEEIAPTDATECTRVVTWFARSAVPGAAVTDRDGHAHTVPVRRVAGRLALDLGPVPAERVARLTVGWPSSLLDRYTVIDTPGTASNNADVSARTLEFLFPDRGACAAEAVIFVMRSRHESDLELLRAIQRSAGGSGPLGIVGVLSRADELDAARERGASLRADPELAGLYRAFVPVSGLLAVRGQTLRQSEFTALRALADLPDADLAAALTSVTRFARLVPDAERLLDGFGLVGVRIAVKLIRAPARDAPSLAAELVRHSGLDELRRLLDARFASRHAELKAHAALGALRGILQRLPAARAARLLRAVERQLAASHAHSELRTLATLSDLPVPEPTRQALERVLGGRGLAAPTRLGLPAGAGPGQLRSAALRAHAYCHQQLDLPLLDGPTERAFRAAARSCEAILSG